MIIRRGFLAVATCCAVFVATPAASGLIPPVDVQASKSAEGPYTDDNQNATVKPGKTKLFFWEVSHPEMAGSDGDYMFDDAATGDDSDYKVTWYKGKKPRKSKKISNAVQGAGFSVHVDQGKAKYFTARVTAVDDTNPLCLGGQATDPDYPASDAVYFAVNGLCTR